MNRICISLSILAFFMEIPVSQTCDSSKPKNRYDCFALSNSNKKCCFQADSSQDPKCVVYDQNLQDEKKKKLDCGALTEYGAYEFTPYRPTQAVQGLDFVSCGRADPINKNDCTDFSHLMNSCCYFKDSQNTGCFYIGKRYEGNKTMQNFTENKNNFSFECSSSLLILKSIFFISIILYLF